MNVKRILTTAIPMQLVSIKMERFNVIVMKDMKEMVHIVEVDKFIIKFFNWINDIIIYKQEGQNISISNAITKEAVLHKQIIGPQSISDFDLH